MVFRASRLITPIPSLARLGVRLTSRMEGLGAIWQPYARVNLWRDFNATSHEPRDVWRHDGDPGAVIGYDCRHHGRSGRERNGARRCIRRRGLRDERDGRASHDDRRGCRRALALVRRPRSTNPPAATADSPSAPPPVPPRPISSRHCHCPCMPGRGTSPDAHRVCHRRRPRTQTPGTWPAHC